MASHGNRASAEQGMSGGLSHCCCPPGCVNASACPPLWGGTVAFQAAGAAGIGRPAAQRRKMSEQDEGSGSCGTEGWRRRRGKERRLPGGQNGSP